MISKAWQNLFGLNKGPEVVGGNGIEVQGWSLDLTRASKTEGKAVQADSCVSFL